jgi:methylphosphotriester-DNA--protein-cysteine methyltransferase
MSTRQWRAPTWLPSWAGSTKRMIRDFQRHTGVTPAEYAAAQQSTYARSEAVASAGFVPDKR